jgi:transcriptional antiterminator RfaH
MVERKIMHWYLVHTKPKQEACALQNLSQQGFDCYLPLMSSEKLFKGMVSKTTEPLFPRYLFIRLDTSNSAKSWSPIRSTRGVSKLVSFGNQPAKVADDLVELIRAREFSGQVEEKRLFTPGESIRVVDGPFAGVEGIFQSLDGTQRVMILIELMSKPVRMAVAPASIRRAEWGISL